MMEDMGKGTAVRCGLGVIVAAAAVATAAFLAQSGDAPATGRAEGAGRGFAPAAAVPLTFDPPESHVLVVGDSLLDSSTDQVSAALRAQGREPVIAAIGGTGIEFWAGRMGELVSLADPDVVVIGLGTNNCDTTCVGVSAAIRELLHAVPADTPVYWLNVQQQPFYPRDAAAVNERIEAAAMADSRVTVVDLDSRFRDHPEWHIADGLHFTPEGSQQLAGLITDAITTSP
jgi:lysophospholipase L1-like esterase